MDTTKDGHPVIPPTSDGITTHNNNNNNNNNQPSEPVLNPGRSDSAQDIKEQDTAPGTSRRRSSSAGNKLRRRKAQFEVGDDNHEATHQEVQKQNRDTAGEEAEGDEPHPQKKRQQQRGHSTRDRRASTTTSHAHGTTTTTTTAVGVKDNGEEVEEDQARKLNNRRTMQHQPTSIGRDEESLAKTLIDSTLTQSMRGLGLQSQLAQSEHTQGRQQEIPIIQEPVQSLNPGIAQQGHLPLGDQQSMHGQEPHEQSGSEHPPSNGQAASKGKNRDNNERAVRTHTTGERAGHVLEKSKSNPPEAVSNGEELPEVVHKSSASIHESQNLTGSHKPRRRALSRNSQISKRMSMLLDPSTSTTSHPSLTKVTTHTVMAINPKQIAVVGTDPSSSSTGAAEVSHTQGLKASSPTLQPSPAVELVSKFLTMGGAGTSTGHAAAEDEHSHSANGSPSSHRRSPRGGYDKSNATSPQQRAGYTSKFYPASPSQPQLSSSAPKASTMSNHLIPPTIVTTSIGDEHLPDIGASTAPYSSIGLAPAATGSAIAAAAVAQSNLVNGSKTGTLSRTQQKLWLQRENLQDVDEDEMARRGRLQKEIDRINREYKCVRMTLDPSVESILRCMARSGKSPLQLQQEHQQQQQSSPQSSRPSSQHLPEKQSLQHHRSLQKLNGHYQSQAQQQQPHSQLQQQQQSQQQQPHRSTQAHVGLGLQSTNQQSRGGAGGAATMGRDAGKMALRQMQQMRQPPSQQAQPQQQQQQQYR
ncbi:hypothetical protein BG011_001483 [Mortierella polycephala]|uniref:Uncharacterized protein n=1 Tax=Mortierella polycephala TaxID=41804 RepID=A0A9P6QE59_9FUNG|nr:hypothetical protein BG011_001483 [Mortierella polycephala]